MLGKIIGGLVAAVLIAGCGGNPDQQSRPARGSSIALTGAGATFPYPLYSKWFADYASETGVRINYQSIGSGGGIRQLSDQTVDFGATDSPMTEEEMSRARGGAVLHIPTILGAVVVTYNLPGVQQQVRLNGAVLADIFSGRITRWNDARIAQLNPGVNLPATDILVVHRSDGSGTTYIFTDYLSTVSPTWAQRPGRGKEVQWPVGLGAKGNEGVAGQVRQLPGSIGYVELAYARQNNLSYAAIQNAAGQYVNPDIESVTAAAAGVGERLGGDTDYRLSVVDAPGERAYPIASFTWILVYQQQADTAKGRHLVEFLRWAMTEGQRSAAALHYAPLPAGLRNQLVQRIETISVGSGS